MLRPMALLRCLCAHRPGAHALAPLRALSAAAPAPAASGAAADAADAVPEVALDEEAAVLNEEEDAPLEAPNNNLALPADSFVRVSSSKNNMQITVSDLEGRVISRSTGGMVSFKHRERASAEASEAATQQAVAKAVAKGFKMCHLEMKGNSSARGQVLRGIVLAGLNVKSIRDTTPVPTPGVRPPASRRL